MHEAICAKCGKSCQVPFRPTGDKPVYCSDCFRQQNDSGSSGGFGSRERSPVSAQPGISVDQFKQLNIKLDKILKLLSELEIDVSDDEDEEVDENLDEDAEDEKEDAKGEE
jgi:CxxC-x17-CxxC domain-containing protein